MLSNDFNACSTALLLATLRVSYRHIFACGLMVCLKKKQTITYDDES